MDRMDTRNQHKWGENRQSYHDRRYDFDEHTEEEKENIDYHENDDPVRGE